MCIFFLSTECPFEGLQPTLPLSILFNSSRRPSTGAATSSAQSNMSSRSSITTISTYSNGSNDSLHEMLSITESSKAPTSEHPIQHFRIPTSPEAESPAVSLYAEDSAVSDYITAINTLTNTLENTSGIKIGCCLDPTSPVPSQCKNFQIRHCSSSKRQTGYFDKCNKCTDVGKQWQESREEEETTWTPLSETNSRGQKVRKAQTGMCSTHGCEGCRPAKT